MVATRSTARTEPPAASNMTQYTEDACAVARSYYAKKEAMDNYKGPAGPPPKLLLGGFLAAAASLTFFYRLSTPSVESSLTIMLACKWLVLVGAFFCLETHYGVMIRSTSPKLSYCPPSAQASKVEPFALVEHQRIHMNQIEAFMYFLPSLLTVAAHCDEFAPYDERMIPSMVFSWVLARTVYRRGYKSKDPINRLFGMTWSLGVTLPGLAYGIYRLFSG
mmetsp:Transcript_24569/g.73968  ORF Transcript_24569/g.73968 Transcript_24569/m.73968 type:complete len:220 (+) Transcript_24569:51-710(+)